jgi:hypothetical protein
VLLSDPPHFVEAENFFGETHVFAERYGPDRAEVSTPELIR